MSPKARLDPFTKCIGTAPIAIPVQGDGQASATGTAAGEEPATSSDTATSPNWGGFVASDHNNFNEVEGTVLIPTTRLRAVFQMRTPRLTLGLA